MRVTTLSALNVTEKTGNERQSFPVHLRFFCLSNFVVSAILYLLPTLSPVGEVVCIMSIADAFFVTVLAGVVVHTAYNNL